MLVKKHLVLWISAALLLINLTSNASTPTVTLNIEAQPLGDALNKFAEQSGLQLVFYSQIGEGLIAPAVAGTFSPDSALKRLLAHTSLSYEFVNERTIAIRQKPQKISRENNAVSMGESSLHLAQSSANDPTKDRTLAVNTRDRGPPSEEDESGAVDRSSTPEIFVKGSRVLNMDLPRSRDDVQPYVVFDRKIIERSGAHTIEDFLRGKLTSMSSPSLNAQNDGGNNESLIDLRGLGPEQTLVLVDGHRIASKNVSGRASQPDLNGIPLSAIERIEVLPSTASGIYGGGATGGVLNVILRRDYSGMETKLTYGNSFDGGGGNRRIDLAAGFNLEGGKTNVLLAGSYSDATDLLVGDRDFIRRGRSLALANNPSSLLLASEPPLGATTNISTERQFDFATFLATGQVQFLPGPNLVLDDGTVLTSNITSVPYGYSGAASDGGAALAQNAGNFNLDPANTSQYGAGAQQALVNSPTIKSLTATVRREFTPWMQGFLDLSGSRNSGTFVSNRTSSSFFVPQDAANNPFAQDIVVTTPAFGTNRANTTISENIRAVGGAIFQLPRSWKAGADYTWSRSRSPASISGADLNADAAIVVRNGATSTGAPFDIFRDTNAVAVNFSEYLSPDTVVSPSWTTLKDAMVRVSGPLGFLLPAGMPTLTALLERRKEHLDDYVIIQPTSTTTAFGRSQSIDSVYLESDIPLVSTQNTLPGVRSLALELKARRDEYSMVGANTSSSSAPQPFAQVTRKFSSTDPTFGLRYEPIEDVAVRASYAEGFVPPALAQLVPTLPETASGFILEFLGVTDPRRGNEIIGGGGDVELSGGGNPNLLPERSKSRSVGIVVTPRVIPGLRVSIDRITIDKQEDITGVGLDQTTLDNELSLPGVIVRDPPSGVFDVGPITRINGGFVNVARKKIEVYDIAVDHRLSTTAWGTFSLAAAATRNIHNLTQILPTSAVTEAVGTISALRWQANTTVTWDYRQWAVGWTARFLDFYWLQPNHAVAPEQGSATIPRQSYHDVFANYRFDALGKPDLLANTEVQFGVKNLLNTSPPILALAPYYSTYGDPRLANYYISIRKSFD